MDWLGRNQNPQQREAVEEHKKWRTPLLVVAGGRPARARTRGVTRGSAYLINGRECEAPRPDLGPSPVHQTRPAARIENG